MESCRPLAAEPVYQVQYVRYSIVRSVRDDAVREVLEATIISPRQRTGLALRSATGRNATALADDLAYRRCAGALHPIVLVRCNVVQRLPLPLELAHERKRVDEAGYGADVASVLH